MDREPDRSTTIAPPANLDLFGFQPTRATVRVVPRTTTWRVGHALVWLVLCWAGILLVMWVPPHVPWILGAFTLGIYFFVRYIRERYTLLTLEGSCPHCGAAVEQTRPGRLDQPHRLTCTACHQVLLLNVALDRSGDAASAR